MSSDDNEDSIVSLIYSPDECQFHFNNEAAFEMVLIRLLVIQMFVEFISVSVIPNVKVVNIVPSKRLTMIMRMLVGSL